MANNDPTLIIRDMPLRGTADIERISNGRYLNLRQSRRLQGGDWEASCLIPVGDRYNAGLLAHWFQSWLMKRFIISSGGSLPWRGVIWEMTLVKNGTKRVISVADVWNAVKTIYTESGTSTQLETSFFTDIKSIELYGRREYLLYLDNVPLSQAEAAAQTFLAESAAPRATLTAIGTSEAPGLYIQAVGDVFTLNNQYATTTTNGEEDVSVFIADTVTTDSEFLSTGRIAENTLQVEKEQRGPTRVWDLLLALAELGDGSVPYRIWVSDGRVNYQPIDATPIYEYRGLKTGLQTVTGQPRTWDAVPGVARDYTIPSGAPPPDSFLTDARDAMIDEIQMWQGAAAPTPRIGSMAENDLLQGYENYQRMMTDYTWDPVHTISRDA